MNMAFPKKYHIALLAGLAASICGISATAFSGFASDGAIEAPSNSTSVTKANASDEAYLKPCNSCNATEADYENLTTLELLAIYPELTGDPLDNATRISSNEETDALTGLETTNSTLVIPGPIGNATTHASNQSSVDNLTRNFTIMP
jgi:hypothetical protein